MNRLDCHWMIYMLSFVVSILREFGASKHGDSFAIRLVVRFMQLYYACFDTALVVLLGPTSTKRKFTFLKCITLSNL